LTTHTHMHTHTHVHTRTRAHTRAHTHAHTRAQVAHFLELFHVRLLQVRQVHFWELLWLKFYRPAAVPDAQQTALKHWRLAMVFLTDNHAVMIGQEYSDGCMDCPTLRLQVSICCLTVFVTYITLQVGFNTSIPQSVMVSVVSLHCHSFSHALMHMWSLSTHCTTAYILAAQTRPWYKYDECYFSFCRSFQSGV